MTAVTIGGANEAVRASIAKSIAAWHGGDRTRIRILLAEMLAPHVAADLLRRVLLRLRTAANGIVSRKFDDAYAVSFKSAAHVNVEDIAQRRLYVRRFLYGADLMADAKAVDSLVASVIGDHIMGR